MREQAVVALDRHDRLVGIDLVAVPERAQLQLRETVLPATFVATLHVAARAELDDGDGLVDPAQHGAFGLLEDLHHHAGV